MTKVLIVYYSQTGEQYTVGNITKGNTEIVAEIIAEKTGGDLFQVKVKNDNYPKGYMELTEYAKEEKNKNVRPDIIGDVENFDDYDIIFIGSPVWWSDMPMPLYTFLEKHDFSNKKVAPFITHEGSGSSLIPNNIRKALKPLEMLEDVNIYGHVAQNKREQAEKEVEDWLKRIKFFIE